MKYLSKNSINNHTKFVCISLRKFSITNKYISAATTLSKLKQSRYLRIHHAYDWCSNSSKAMKQVCKWLHNFAKKNLQCFWWKFLKAPYFHAFIKEQPLMYICHYLADIYKSDAADDHVSTSSSEMAQLEDVCLSQGMNTISNSQLQ